MDLYRLNLLFKTHYTQNKSENRCACSPQPLPLCKTTNLKTAGNDTSISCRMRYSQIVKSQGTTMSSTSSVKKTCSLGGATFAY